jgi:glyoxylase I family protein
MKIHHLALRTQDLARLRSFYVEALGLVVSQEAEASVWLHLGEAILMLEVAAEGEPVIADKAIDLIAFAVDPEERAALELTLAARGVPIEGRTEFTIYFRDPDGRRVGVSHYPRQAPSRKDRS